MSGYKFWTNVSVAMASLVGIGAAIQIDNISKASPAVVSYTGADPANGAIVLLKVNGMTQVNNRLFRVAAVDAAANTFQLEGVDSTLFRTFIAAGSTFQVVTFNPEFSTLSEPTAGGGDPVFEDTTLVHDPEDTQEVVSSSPQTYGFSSVWDPTNPALIEANRAFVTRTPRPFRITYADGSIFLAYATCSAPLAPGASGKKVSTPISLALKATGTSYGPAA